jgi:mannan endo-1,4-beta-mannosidase
MVYSAEGSGLRGYVDEVLDEGTLLGLTVARTWAFNDGAGQWNALQTSPGVYQESVFRGLDYVIAQAKARGLRLILTFVNNWDDYGGMNQYVAWSPTATRHDDFYTDASCKQWYKEHIRAILNRVNVYTGIRCNTLQSWIEEMSAYVKSMDPQHMVTAGIEGFYAGANANKNPVWWMQNKGTDFIRNHQPAAIDFATFHNWPDHWNITLPQFTQWNTDHISDAEKLLNKPVIVEEFGKYEPLAERDAYYQACYQEVYNSASQGGAAGGSCFWILYHDAYSNYDGFGVYYPAHGSTTQIIAQHALEMNQL